MAVDCLLKYNFMVFPWFLGTLRCSRKFPGETVTEETSTGVNEFGVEDRDGVVVAAEEKNSNSEAPQAEDEETQALEFLNDIKVSI